jgi:peroxiredoxin
MIKVLQANCRASEDIMTALMSAAVRAGAEVVLIQKPSVKEEEDRWKAKIKDGNYIYIYSDDVTTVTITSGMVMGESHLGVGLRSKKSSMVGD